MVVCAWAAADTPSRPATTRSNPAARRRTAARDHDVSAGRRDARSLEVQEDPPATGGEDSGGRRERSALRGTALRRGVWSSGGGARSRSTATGSRCPGRRRATRPGAERPDARGDSDARRRTPAAVHSPERARVAARPPVPRLTAKPKRRKTPETHCPAPQESGPGHADAAGAPAAGRSVSLRRRAAREGGEVLGGEPRRGHSSRLSALGSRLSALGSRLSALGSRLSALSYAADKAAQHCRTHRQIPR